MADEILRIGAEFDVAPVIAGTRKVVEGFDRTASSAQQMAQRMAAAGLSFTEASSAMKNLGFTAGETSSALASVGLAAEQASSGLNQVSNASEKAAYSITEARIAAQGLSQELGVRAPRALTSFIARSQTLGPILAGAFSAIALVAFVEILAKVPDLINKATEALVGWDEAAKKAYKEQLELNQRAISSEISRQDAIEKTNLVGKTGSEKYSLELKDNADHLKRLAVAATDTQHRINELQNLIQQHNPDFANDPLVGAYRLAHNWITADGEALKQNKEEQANLVKLAAQYAEELRKGRIETEAQVRAEMAAAAIRQSRETEAVGIEGAKQAADQREKNAVETAHTLRALQKITIDEEFDMLIQSEQRKFNAEREATEKLIENYKKYGSEKLVEIARLKASELTSELAFNNAIQALHDRRAIEDTAVIRRQAEDSAKWIHEGEAKAVEEREKDAAKALSLEEENARAQLSVIKKTADERIAIEEKAGAFTSAKGTASDELAQETRLIQGLIALEKARQQAIAHTLLGEQQKGELADASLTRETQLQNQLTQAAERYREELQKVTQEQKQSLEKMTSAFNANFVQWVNGTETFAKAMAKTWMQMADQFITSILKIGEQMVINFALQQSLSEGTKLTDAKTAAANTYASVSAIPLVGWILAPPAAAAAFAAVMAFEKGGLVPETGLAMLHAREMVLPAPIAMGLETAIATSPRAVSLPDRGFGTFGSFGNFDGSTNTRSSNVTNNHSNLKVELHGHGMNPEDIFGMEDKLVAAIQRATRRGKLPS